MKEVNSKMKIKLKNYTTQIPAEKTIMEIEKLLSMFGATHIMKEYYSDGRVKALFFRYNNRAFRIPANIEGVKKVLFEGKKMRYRVNEARNRDERAYRVCWRIIKDWLYSQLSLIYSKQAEPEEVLLPYMYDGKRTLYEAYKEGLLQIDGERLYLPEKEVKNERRIN